MRRKALPVAGSVARVRGCSDAPGRGCARVGAMFAHSTYNWWWTAHPAAH
ncbi:trp operon leader peptide [Streptomyces sp. KLOTTS4A1]